MKQQKSTELYFKCTLLSTAAHPQAFSTAEILTCLNRNRTGVTNNVTDASVLIKCPSKLELTCALPVPYMILQRHLQAGRSTATPGASLTNIHFELWRPAAAAKALFTVGRV